MKTKRTKLFIRGVMVLISIVITLAGLEIIIRTKEKIWPMTSYQTPNFIKEITEETSLRKTIQKKEISAKTFNIYYFGESSMWGEPYVDTIPILVEKMLQGKVDGKELRWVNMGIPGIDFNEVSKRIKQIVEQKNIYFPSLVVIYSGHNEFLFYQDNVGFSFRKNDSNPIAWLAYRSRLAYRVAKFFKLYKLEIDDRAFFDEAIVSKEKYTETINNYENKVLSTISYLRNNEVPMVISTVAGNYADFEPNRSVYTGEELKKEEFKKDMDEGADAYNNGKIKEALESYNKALKIDNKFAETYYRLGKIYQKLQQNDKAWEAYSKAVDNDMLPIRMTSVQNEFIRKLTEDNNTQVIDAVSYLRQKSDNTLIGRNFFTDAQHPNIKGYTLISELYAKKIADMYPNNTKFTPLSEAEADKMFNTEKGLYDLYISRATTMLRLASWRYDPAQRLIEAENYLKKAETTEIFKEGGKQYWYLLKMTLAYLKKDVTEANEYYQKAKMINTKSAIEFLRDPWINQVVTRALN